MCIANYCLQAHLIVCRASLTEVDVNTYHISSVSGGDLELQPHVRKEPQENVVVTPIPAVASAQGIDCKHKKGTRATIYDTGTYGSIVRAKNISDGPGSSSIVRMYPTIVSLEHRSSFSLYSVYIPRLSRYTLMSSQSQLFGRGTINTSK